MPAYADLVRDEAIDGLRLTLRQMAIIEAAEPCDIALGAIAESLRMNKPDVTRNVDKLVKHGVVRREPHPTDRRVCMVRVTDTGRALYRRIAD